MDLTTITIDQFKAQFRRDFPYTPVYDPTIIYNTGDVAFYAPTGLFYQCQADGVKNIGPLLKYDQGNKYDADGNKYDSNTKYWVKYIADPLDFVDDIDITNAFAEALIIVNPALFSTNTNLTLGFLYMAAHYLCNDVQAARGGVNGAGRFPVAGRTVGSVSETYSIPKAYQDDPLLAMFAQTPYGLKYLSMVLPALRGNMVAVFGGTNP